MENNKIELKSIRELLGMKFVIPGYQRGYRWTEQQVKDLLRDISDFMADPSNSLQFYCIQPLVVKECIGNLDEFKKRVSCIQTNVLEEVRKLIDSTTMWEVIDGQQRLTTIFILLSYFKVGSLFSMDYLTRKGSVDFLTHLRDKNQDEAERNIDFYHMYEAYQTVNQWFQEHADERENFLRTLLDRVKFIWYQSVGEDPIKVFTRLNIGKISLTNSELIKALCLNRSNFMVQVNKSHSFSQFELASQWDRLEYALQNDEFWLFLMDVGYKRPTRIDFIFDLICEQQELGVFENLGSDDYRTFRYFYEYFRTEHGSVDEFWSTVEKYYQIFMEWYNDLELYHYIGYLLAEGDSLYSLVSRYSQADDKSLFLRSIKESIYQMVSHPKLDYQYHTDGSDKGKCRHILLFHNIQTVINQNAMYAQNDKYGAGIFYKFPFHLFKKENWDVEHICSITTNPEEDENTQKEWLINVYAGVDEDLQHDIRNSFSKLDASVFENIRSRVNTGREWTSEEKNRIWNYVLLDSSTNRSYGNAIFSAKRRILVGKDKGRLIPVPKLTKDGHLVVGEECPASSSFVPPCTKQVFLKYYSSRVGHSNYWDKEIDAVCYLLDIEKCIYQLNDKESNHEQ